MKQKFTLKSKLEVTELFIKAPMNFKCLLTSNERDFLEAVIHLQSLGKYHTSDSLIMANSGLNSRQITVAKQNLIALDLLNVATDKCPIGSRYMINEQTYNELLRHLNSTQSATERFMAGDTYRKSRGLKPIFTNIIHTLHRRLKTIDVPDEERITTTTDVQPKQESKQKEIDRLKELLNEGKITPEEYHNRKNKLW